MKSFKKPQTKEDIINMLGDETGGTYKIYRNNDMEDVKTIAVGTFSSWFLILIKNTYLKLNNFIEQFSIIGLFDCNEKTWSIYADNPKRNEPIITIPLTIKSIN